MQVENKPFERTANPVVKLRAFIAEDSKGIREHLIETIRQRSLS